MIEQEVVETAVEEKSMARLAEVLSGMRGVKVLQHFEVDDVFECPTLTFLCEDELDAALVVDAAIARGYSLDTLSRSWSYRLNTRCLPYWVMEFSTSS